MSELDHYDSRIRRAAWLAREMHGQRDGWGRVQQCGPQGNKACYPTEGTARAAAAIVAAVIPHDFRAYRCPDDGGHWHFFDCTKRQRRRDRERKQNRAGKGKS